MTMTKTAETGTAETETTRGAQSEATHTEFELAPVRLTPKIVASLERIAARASDLRHTAVEDLCDRALDGEVNPSAVFGVILDDTDYWPDEAVDRLLRDIKAGAES